MSQSRNNNIPLWIDRIRRFERNYEYHLRQVHGTMAADGLSLADLRVVQELGFSDGGGATPSSTCSRASGGA